MEIRDPRQRSSDSHDLVAALGRLNEQRRAAVESMYLEGRTQREASAHTGIPLGSLKRYAQDGLTDLRRMLQAS